jgi:hypothetical protein
VDPDIQAPELLESLFGLGTKLLLARLPDVFAGRGPQMAVPQVSCKLTAAVCARLHSGGAVVKAAVHHGVLSLQWACMCFPQDEGKVIHAAKVRSRKHGVVACMLYRAPSPALPTLAA